MIVRPFSLSRFLLALVGVVLAGVLLVAYAKWIVALIGVLLAAMLILLIAVAAVLPIARP